MTPFDAVDLLATLRIGQSTKQALVGVRHQRCDLMPMVEHRRDGHVVATVHAAGESEVDGSSFPARSTAIGALGFHSDEIRVTLEMVNQTLGPDEAGIARGELHRRLREDPTSTVQESLIVIGVAMRHGIAHVEARYAPYEYAERDGGGVDVRWLEPEDAVALGAPGQIVADLTRMLQPSPLRGLFVDLLTDDEGEHDQAHLDHVTARAITRQFRHQVMVATPG